MRRISVMGNEIFENYYDTFYKDLHGWRDYELTSKKYGEWYYDCLPADKAAMILDIGCGDGKFLFFLKQKNTKKLKEWSFLSSRLKRRGKM
jgi:tRNA G46 methylase TrmB